MATEPEGQHILDALDDPDCRRILEVTAEDPLSVKEVADACGLSLTTAYRKLKLLTEARLLGVGTRFDGDEHHAGEYVCTVQDVVVTLDVGADSRLDVTCRPPVNSRAGFEMRWSRRDTGG